MTSSDHALQIDTLLRHRDWVRGVARALGYGDHDADDLEQEAWLAALQAPPRDDASPRGWLGTVLRRTAAKTRRRDEARRARELASNANPQSTSSADLVAEAEMHARVVRSVLALPEPYRATILRRFFEGLPLREIAPREGIPIDTVRSRLRRGLALLRSEFQRDESHTWPLVLIPLAGAPAAKAAPSVAAGVLLMSYTKAAVLVAVVMLIAGVAWFAMRDEAPADHGPSLSPRAELGRTVAELPAAADAGARAAETIKSRPFDPASESEPAAADSRSGSATTGTINVRVIWGDDKTPAAGVRLHVVEWGTKSGMWKESDSATGPEGTMRLDRVSPGLVGFYVDRGGGDSVSVAAGERKDVVLVIPPGPTIAGIVVDPDGKPVPGADVWLSDYGNMCSGRVLTRADASGEFTLRSVSPIRWVAARERAHAPSPAYVIHEGKAGETIKLRVSLGGPAGSVRGAVTRSDGAPVGGARIHLVPAGERGAAGSMGAAPPPIVAHTDEAGLFLIEGLPAGTNQIAVRLAGLAPWSGTVEITAGEVAALDVRVPGQAVVFGTIKLSSGEPAAGAEIGVGGYGDFLSSTTKSADDGSFRIDSLAPGSIQIRASVRGKGKAVATLECAEGAEVRWDPVLESGLRITGVVRDEEDRPLAGWIISARKMKHDYTWQSGANTDAAGRFEVVNCPPDSTFRVEVWEKGKIRGDGVRAILEDVAAGEDRVIRIDSKSLITVKGRILDADGKPVAATIRLTPARYNLTFTFENDPATGAFSVGPLLSGRWRITVDRKPLGTLDLGEREIEPGAVVDFGDVKLAEPGRLFIEIAGDASLAEQVTYEIGQVFENAPGQPTAWAPPLRSAHRDLVSPLLAGPGTYSIEVTGPRIITQRVSVEVRSGQDARVRVAPELKEAK